MRLESSFPSTPSNSIQGAFVRKYQDLLSAGKYNKLNSPFFQFQEGVTDGTPTGGACNNLRSLESIEFPELEEKPAKKAGKPKPKKPAKKATKPKAKKPSKKVANKPKPKKKKASPEKEILHLVKEIIKKK